ncbi:hypothetical protein SASPL_121227 [Salvia splendens]|uniref:Peroxisomal membrane protein 2 n=1 Tax=Salvia splendens TaxID=180675 RepID=A0A8X8XUH2_SALSN|nr:hypothetical protein SASPL_121227 [Salvia splendens]
MITAGVLSAVSDVAAQKLSAIQKLQPKRLLLKVIFGSAYLCPLSHYFHILLDKIFKGKKDTKTVAKKVLLILVFSTLNETFQVVLEQLTISPWNNLMFMIYTTASLSLQYLLLMHFPPVVGWVNHQYVPLQFHVIVQGVFACFWGIFLNLKAKSLAPAKP